MFTSKKEENSFLKIQVFLALGILSKDYERAIPLVFIKVMKALYTLLLQVKK